MRYRRKFKDLAKYIGFYSLAIAFIIGLRRLHHMEIDWHYYTIVTIIILSCLIVFSFIEPEHIERVLPKNSRASLILTLTLRFLPLAKQKIANIKNNQQMRGANFKGFSQVKNYMSLLIPSVIVALRWSDNVSEGIKMRGGD